MKTFKIPVTWEVYGTVEIEAKTLEEALEKFDAEIAEIELPSDPEYVDSSFKRDDEVFCEFMNQI